ncbi:ABC transporter substrate-binding protein [Halobacillus yeomjeoni]|uniref:Iron-siderophore ABC transporter substrate-binding protein n=1 Tax=Halobacillus yeomjeoni TaxID=311194 RepID=A0A931MUW5_9BACI|nr:iron-siderophore ABC transporter substrate-binding protein [Halobacillus yeomjeoni]MBH0229756.1 iron-siderophore ABC transporter substrate-binding protein [Halobacillus yeomjeoni]
MSKKYIVLFSLVFTFTLLLSACGGSEETSEQEDKQKEANGFEPYTVEHAMGTTTVEEKPERVVILTNEGTEALLALGKKPVGAVKSWTGDPWYDHISDQMEGVEVLGDETNVNIEKIIELKPDLIIGNKMRQEDVYDKLSAIAPTIFSETLRGEWQNNFMTYAKALNMEDKGQKMIDEYDQRLDSFAEKAGDKLNQKVSVIRFMPDHVRIYHKDSFSGVILEEIGFQRPESQDVNDFMEKATKERIPAMDGDVLFYFTYEPGDGAATNLEEEWLNDPLFQNLEVAKEGDVHKVSDAIWNTAGGYIAANKMVDDLEEYFLDEEQ